MEKKYLFSIQEDIELLVRDLDKKNIPARLITEYFENGFEEGYHLTKPENISIRVVEKSKIWIMHDETTDFTYKIIKGYGILDVYNVVDEKNGSVFDKQNIYENIYEKNGSSFDKQYIDENIDEKNDTGLDKQNIDDEKNYEIKYCSQCGTEANINANFCENCGNSFDKSNQSGANKDISVKSEERKASVSKSDVSAYRYIPSLLAIFACFLPWIEISVLGLSKSFDALDFTWGIFFLLLSFLSLLIAYNTPGKEKYLFGISTLMLATMFIVYLNFHTAQVISTQVEEISGNPFGNALSLNVRTGLVLAIISSIILMIYSYNLIDFSTNNKIKSRIAPGIVLIVIGLLILAAFFPSNMVRAGDIEDKDYNLGDRFWISGTVENKYSDGDVTLLSEGDTVYIHVEEHSDFIKENIEGGDEVFWLVEYVVDRWVDRDEGTYYGEWKLVRPNNNLYNNLSYLSMFFGTMVASAGAVKGASKKYN